MNHGAPTQQGVDLVLHTPSTPLHAQTCDQKVSMASYKYNILAAIIFTPLSDMLSSIIPQGRGVKIDPLWCLKSGVKCVNRCEGVNTAIGIYMKPLNTCMTCKLC